MIKQATKPAYTEIPCDNYPRQDVYEIKKLAFVDTKYISMAKAR